MRLTIPGIPKSQPRARFRRFGKFVNTYDPATFDKQVVQQFIALAYKNKIKYIKPPIEFKLVAYMPIAKSLSKKKAAELLDEFHTKKPDIDNIYKFYSDCLKGIFYHDDSEISKIVCEKVYSIRPSVEIEISCLEKS